MDTPIQTTTAPDPNTLILLIPLALATPNRDRGAHWSTRHKLTKIWEREIWAAWHQRRDWDAWLIPHEALERRRVTIIRHHATRRTFCKDSDNRMFAGKGIRDALTRLHLLVDDSDRWLESEVIDYHDPEHRIGTEIQIRRALA